VAAAGGGRRAALQAAAGRVQRRYLKALAGASGRARLHDGVAHPRARLHACTAFPAEACLAGDGLGNASRGAPPLGAHSMTDLWIFALTIGLFGVAAWFVRICERM
jgi:hypothetical protein